MTLALSLALHRLRQHHNVDFQAVVLPMLPPTTGPMIVQGLASITTIDREHTRIRARAFTWGKDVPLLFRHGEVAGTSTNFFMMPTAS